MCQPRKRYSNRIKIDENPQMDTVLKMFLPNNYNPANSPGEFYLTVAGIQR